MLTTGIFETHYYPIRVNSLAGSPEIIIMPFGDVHYGAPLHSPEYFGRFCERAKELISRHPGKVYFIGMGDLQDMLSTSEREVFLNPHMHDSTRSTIEDWWDKKIKEFYKLISFMRGRCIGLIEGNHFAQFEDGTTSTNRLCKLLDTKYLGCSCFIRMNLAYTTGKVNRGTGTSIDIWAHHGKGAANMAGGSLNTVERMGMAADADIMLMGHDHRVGSWPTTRLRLRGTGNGLKVEHRDILLCRTGSFLRGYVKGSKSYVADKALNPTQMGWVEIRIALKRKHNGVLEHELHASV